MVVPFVPAPHGGAIIVDIGQQVAGARAAGCARGRVRARPRRRRAGWQPARRAPATMSRGVADEGERDQLAVRSTGALLPDVHLPRSAAACCCGTGPLHLVAAAPTGRRGWALQVERGLR
jgi:hypothetical protein